MEDKNLLPNITRRRMLKISSKAITGVVFASSGINAFALVTPENTMKKSDIGKVRTLPLGSVTIEGMLGRRYRLNIDYLLWRYKDADRLLFPFEHRDKWQRIRDWDGEYAGKWLDAAVLTVSATRHPELQKAVDQFARRLQMTQEEDGYLGTELPENRLKASWPGWMNWLVIKALREYSHYSGEKTSLDAAIRGANWVITQFNPIIDENNPFFRGNGVLAVLDELAELFSITGNSIYCEFAQKAIALYPKMKNMRDSGKVDIGHSYSNTTYLGGAVCVSQVCGDHEMIGWLSKVWDDIAYNHTFPTGSNSTNENLKEPPSDVVNGKLQETCTTVEWIIFTHRLYLATGDVRFANMLELTVRNALLGAQSCDGKKWTYFLPMRSSKAWMEGPTDCCFFSGPRGIARLPEMIYHTDPEGIRIDMFESGTANFTVNEVSVVLHQETTYPEEGNVHVRIEPAHSVNFNLKLRIPEHTDGVIVKINGKLESVKTSPGEYVLLNHTWGKGDTVDLVFDPIVSLVKISDGTATIQRGVQVLSLDGRDNTIDLEKVRILEPVVLEKFEKSSDGRARYLSVFDIEGKAAPLILTPFSEAGNASAGILSKDAHYRTAFPVV